MPRRFLMLPKLQAYPVLHRLMHAEAQVRLKAKYNFKQQNKFPSHLLVSFESDGVGALLPLVKPC